MYSALLLDDEELARKTLRGLLAMHCPQITHIHEAQDTEEAIRVLAKHPVDFLFLDIELGGQSGFDALNHIQTHAQAVIFVTAHEEFSLRALKAGALDYLLKPVDIEELKVSVKKGCETLAKNPDTETDNPAKPLNVRIMVAKGGGFDLLEANEIIFAEADGNYTTFYLQGGRRVTSSKQIGFYEELLLPPLFFRSHKSYIINLKYLKGYTSREGHIALMEEEHQVSVSRRKLSEFIDLCKQLHA